MSESLSSSEEKFDGRAYAEDAAKNKNKHVALIGEFLLLSGKYKTFKTKKDAQKYIRSHLAAAKDLNIFGYELMEEAILFFEKSLFWRDKRQLRMVVDYIKNPLKYEANEPPSNRPFSNKVLRKKTI